MKKRENNSKLMEGNSGGGEVELMSKTLQVEHKLFYFDLKENGRGRYLKISEKTSSSRSTIILPSSALSSFFDLFSSSSSSSSSSSTNELQLHSKVFYFHLGQNTRGRFLKISESSPSRNRSTIIVPAGTSLTSSRDEGWLSFRNILADIIDASRLDDDDDDDDDDASSASQALAVVGLSDDVGAGFISAHPPHPPPPPPPPDDVPNLALSKVLRADHKRFFFDLGTNSRGHFLRISEVAGSDRSSIILPLSALKQFHEMVGHFVDITKDRIDGNVRTSEPSPSQR